MKILISGSARKDVFSGDIEIFKKACKSIGSILAQNNHSIIVGSEDAETADLYVTQGYCEANIEGSTVYAYRVRTKETAPYSSIKGTCKNVSFIDRKSKGAWSVNRVEQINNADCVLLISGGSGTLQAGFVSPTLEKPVVAVTCFNGAAKEVWEKIEPRYEEKEKIIRLSNTLQNDWKDGHEKVVLELLQLIKFASPTSKVTVIPHLSYTITVFCLIGAWLYFFNTPFLKIFETKISSLFFVMGISSVLGSTLENGLSYINTGIHVIRKRKILMEIGIALIIGFGLTCVYLFLNGTVTGSFDFSSLLEISNFQRISIIMSLIGLYSGFSINESSSVFKGLLIKSIKSIDSNHN